MLHKKNLIDLMMNKRIIILALLIFSNMVCAGPLPFNEWAKEQWELVPKEQRVSIPDLSIEIDIYDQKNLKIDADPLVRNEYINDLYAVIGNNLSKCIGGNTKIANWYYFAMWASKSAGEVISGEKYEKLGKFKNTLFWAGGAAKLFKDKKSQKEIFANTNAMIAIEMIPLGKIFLSTFCEDDQVSSFDKFSSKFNADFDHEKILLKAFKKYYEAKNTKDPNKKIELITLGSIYQVTAEQMRVDQLLKAIFGSKFIIPKTRDLYKKVATSVAALAIGGENKISINLNQDIKTNALMKCLRIIENPEFYALNQKYDLSNGLDSRVLEFRETAVSDWGNLNQRLKFLAAFFRSFIGSKYVMEMPSIYLKYYISPENYHLISNEDTNWRLFNFKEFFIYKKVKELWNKSFILTKRPNDMFHRAKLFLYLNYSSDFNFPFAQSVSHLTLAIEKASYMNQSLEQRHLLGKGRVSKDLKFWGIELRKINKTMGQRLTFVYLLSEFITKYPIKMVDVFKATRYDRTIIRGITDINNLVPILKEIHLAKKLKVSLDEKTKLNHFREFINWEHNKIIQPRLLEAFKKLGPFVRFFLKHTPNRSSEIFFLRPFNLRSTFSLGCFPKKAYLRTKNFMNPIHRIKQAEEFFYILRELEYDPNMQCFNDDYYLAKFPDAFYQGPLHYLENYFDSSFD